MGSGLKVRLWWLAAVLQCPRKFVVFLLSFGILIIINITVKESSQRNQCIQVIGN